MQPLVMGISFLDNIEHLNSLVPPFAAVNLAGVKTEASWETPPH